MLTSELAYTLSTHSWGARISGSQLTTTPTKLPFLSITTSPTRRNTYGGRGLRAVFEAAGRKKRERESCVLRLDRSHLCLLASFKGLLENSEGVTASASTFGPDQTHLVALSWKLTVRNYWNTCHELLTMFSYFAWWTMDILQIIVCLHLSVGHHE